MSTDAPRLSMAWILPLLPAGFVFGLIGGFLQEHRLIINDVDVPWASILVVITLVVSIRALSMNLETRKAGLLFFLGWLIATIFLAIPNPSGDVIFTADIGAMAYLGSATLLGAAAVSWPLFLGLPDESENVDV